MERGKVFANRGVARNKKPLQNICYRIEEMTSPEGETVYHLYWGYERELNRRGTWSFHGRVTIDDIKKRLGSQWAKFRQGRRQFIVQRRIDGRNIPKAGVQDSKEPAPE
jgi:hypothetical protein